MAQIRQGLTRREETDGGDLEFLLLGVKDLRI